MPDFLRGQKASIQSLCGGLELELELYHKAPMEIDVSCFGLDSAGRLSDERYLVFYNQESSPEGAICLERGAATGAVRFRLALEKLPPGIDKLSFTASIDGTRNMQELERGHVRLLRGEQELGRFSYGAGEFRAERALVVCELYRKGKDWRFNAVGRGFNGGLKALVENFGGMVDSPLGTGRRVPSPGIPPRPSGDTPHTESTPRSKGAAAPTRKLVNALPHHVCARMDDLARQCRGDTEYLAELYKNMFAVLGQYPKAAERSIRVVLCADASGSMLEVYRGGRIQRTVDKCFAFASTLADGCAMDLWAFAAKSRQLGAVTMDNVRDYTFAETGGFERWMSMLNYQYNNEPEAMRDVMMIYGARQQPTMVLFLTDGRINSDWEIEEILIKTSRFPVFWQFIGLHGEEYGVLDRLEEIDGRHTQNAAFLKLDDIDDIGDQDFFDELLYQLDRWLAELTRKKMLQD